MREIASTAHMSFGDIGKIIHRVDGDDGSDLRSKTKATQALHMFNIGKKPIDVAIELDLPESEVCRTSTRVLGVESTVMSCICLPRLKHDFDLYL